MKAKDEFNKGITLVALVITIIILLILATISIQSLTNTGLFQKANEAKEKMQNAEENQAKILNEFENTLKDYSQGIKKQYVEEITLNKTTTTLEIGKQETLIATIKPDNASNKNIIWKSSDENIATVTDGIVTAVSEGTTTITAMSQDGSKVQGDCKLIVEDNVLYLYNEGDECNKITGGWKTWYYVGQINYIRGSDYLRYYNGRGSVAGGWATEKKVDVSKYTKLKALFTYTGRCVASLANSNNGINAYCYTKHNVSTYKDDTNNHWQQDQNKNYYTDISDVNGEFYITFGSNFDVLASDVTIKKVWLEK